MAIKNVVPPPTMTDGNPLSAFGVNQIVEATNFYGQQVFGNNTAWQKFTSYDNLDVGQNRFVMVHKYDNLYIQISCFSEMTPLKVYARKAGANQTLYGLYSQDTTPTSNVITLTFDLSTNPGGFSVNPGDVYFVFLEWTYTGLSIVEYVHEYENSYFTVPSISTLSASTVIDDTYLNSIITPLKSLSALDVSTNYAFGGIRTNQYVTQTDTYMRWRLQQRNRYLHIGFQIQNEGIVRIYLDDQLIETFTSSSAVNSDESYYYDMTTIATDKGITAPSLGDIYEIKFRFSDNGSSGSHLRANFVWELPTP